MGDPGIYSDEVLLKDLRRWQQHARMFVDFAKKTVDKSNEQRNQLTARAETAYSAMIEFVEELHQQLLTCVKKFTADIKAFMDQQIGDAITRNEVLSMQIKEAESNIMDIDKLLKSDHRLAADGQAAAQRCERFFSTCYDGSTADNDYSFLEFVPAGRLIVRCEHLGYLRLCDAWPQDVDLVQVTTEQAVCGKKCKVLIRTNRRHCVNASTYFSAHMVTSDGASLPVELKNNNDGSYFAVFTPENPQMHKLHVQLFGIEVKGSPMQIDVVEDTVKSGLLHCGASDQIDGDSNNNCSILDGEAGKRSRIFSRGRSLKTSRAVASDSKHQLEYSSLNNIDSVESEEGSVNYGDSLLEPIAKLSMQHHTNSYDYDAGVGSTKDDAKVAEREQPSNLEQHGNGTSLSSELMYPNSAVNTDDPLTRQNGNPVRFESPANALMSMKKESTTHSYSFSRERGSKIVNYDDEYEYDTFQPTAKKNSFNEPVVDSLYTFDTDMYDFTKDVKVESFSPVAAAKSIEISAKKSTVPEFDKYATKNTHFADEKKLDSASSGYSGFDESTAKTSRFGNEKKFDSASSGFDSGKSRAKPSRFSDSKKSDISARAEPFGFSGFDEPPLPMTTSFIADNVTDVSMTEAPVVTNRKSRAVESSVLYEYIKKGVQKVKTEFVAKVGQSGDTDDCLFMPVGVTVNHRGDIIICDMRHNAVKIFSIHGKLLVIIKGQSDSRLMRPSATVVNDKHRIFIKDDRCVHVYNSDGTFVTLIGAGELFRPYGLAFNKDDNLMTVDVVRHGPPFICTYTQDGQLIRRAEFSAMRDPVISGGSKLRFVECIDEFIFIVDLGKSVVFKSDFEGNLLGIFGKYGRALGEFNEPSGITKEGNNVLLIADSRNNRIQVFAPDGSVHGCIDLAESIVRPSDIHLTPDGLLYVSNYLRHCIKVFRILPP